MPKKVILKAGDEVAVISKDQIVDLPLVASSGSYNDLTDKPTIPSQISQLENDSGFITNTVNNLTNYYLKTETYTKDEVLALINGISTMSMLVVSSLPTQNISTTTIYLISKSGGATSNVYDEYIYVNNAWEKIGDTQLSLDNYALKTELSNYLPLTGGELSGNLKTSGKFQANTVANASNSTMLYSNGNTGSYNQGTLYLGSAGTGPYFEQIDITAYNEIRLQNDDTTLLEASSDYVKLKNNASNTYLEFDESFVSLKSNNNTLLSGGSTAQTKVGHTLAPTEIYGYYIQIDNLKKVKAPTTSNGNTYGYGSQYQVLTADGVGGVYWNKFNSGVEGITSNGGDMEVNPSNHFYVKAGTYNVIDAWGTTAMAPITIGNTSQKINLVQLGSVTALTTAGGSTYGKGTSGQILMTDGSNVYWGNTNNNLYVHNLTIDVDGTFNHGAIVTLYMKTNTLIDKTNISSLYTTFGAARHIGVVTYEMEDYVGTITCTSSTIVFSILNGPDSKTKSFKYSDLSNVDDNVKPL